MLQHKKRFHFSFIFFLLQLPQTDLDALDPNCRRFRLENGESLAEIDEVRFFFLYTTELYFERHFAHVKTNLADE